MSAGSNKQAMAKLQAEALKGLSSKQASTYKESKCITIDLSVFENFSSDGQRVSAIEFFKLCKLCKIYPVVITFEDLKKIVLKIPEFWQNYQSSKGVGMSINVP